MSIAENNAGTPNDPIEFMTRDAVLRFFGGDQPLHVSTLYRGVTNGLYPKPVRVSGNNVRWIKSECEEAARRMLAARNEPKKPERRGRPRRKRIT